MRPPARPQSRLWAPLNDIFGTEANVRILRVLTRVGSGVSQAELAKRSDLQRSTVHRSIKALADTDIVEYVGTSAQSQVQLRKRNPLSVAIRKLFEAERVRYDEFLALLMKAVASIDPPPLAVWLEDRVGAGRGPRADTVGITLVDSGRTLNQ